MKRTWNQFREYDRLGHSALRLIDIVQQDKHLWIEFHEKLPTRSARYGGAFQRDANGRESGESL